MVLRAQDAPPIPAVPPVQATPPAPGVRSGSPNAIYEAFRNQRSELADQLERLEDQRENVQEQLASPTVTDAAKRGLEQRLTTIDLRIAATDRLLAEADASVARAAAVPGAVLPDPPEPRDGPPEEFFVLAGLFMLFVLLPFSIAYARRIWRRGAAIVTSLPQDIYDRFTRVEQSLDSIAVEVERIGENQRFLTRLQTEQRGLGAGPAEHVEVGEREALRQRKGS